MFYLVLMRYVGIFTSLERKRDLKCWGGTAAPPTPIMLPLLMITCVPCLAVTSSCTQTQGLLYVASPW